MHRILFVLLLLSAFAASATGPVKGAHKLDYLTSEFDDAKGFSDGFKGHDFRALITALKKNPKPKKDEFETSEAYEKRLNAWIASPLMGSLTPTSRIAFTVYGFTLFLADDPTIEGVIEYNADTKVMHIGARPACDSSAGVKLDGSLRTVGHYVGQNAFGAKKTITKIVADLYCLRPTTNVNFDGTFEIPAKDAKNLSAMGKVAFIGRLSETPFAESRDYVSPTISSPREIIGTVKSIGMEVDEIRFYDPISGKVYYRFAAGTSN